MNDQSMTATLAASTQHRLWEKMPAARSTPTGVISPEELRYWETVRWLNQVFEEMDQSSGEHVGNLEP